MNLAATKSKIDTYIHTQDLWLVQDFDSTSLQSIC